VNDFVAQQVYGETVLILLLITILNVH